jgi:predicted acylesterase/phospholipase RssA
MRPLEADSSPASLLRTLQAMKRQYGCTALCLSGGASIGNYHFGVVRALLDEGLLPRVLSGTSSGAVVAAVVGTRTDEELDRALHPAELKKHLHSFEESWWTCGWRFVRSRCMYDQQAWLGKLGWFANSEAVRHMTFAEAFARTGRVLNITCTASRKHNPSLLLNHVTSPHVTIESAILASAAVPGFIQPVVLHEKINGRLKPYHDKELQWCDGSLQRDLPLGELSEQYGAC